MKVRLALAAALALPLGLSAMPTAVEYLPTKISLSQAVKLGDGSVLPAGPYDVQIHYKGFGNAAELWFFQNGQLKGKNPAEARGFPSTAPGAASESNVKLQKASYDGKVFPKVEDSSQGKVFPKVEGSSAQADHKGAIDYKEQKHPLDPASARQSFSWGAYGFLDGQKGIVTPGPPSKVKLSFDSANSAAGFSAILPYVEKSGK
jgi:hypothetical protein